MFFKIAVLQASAGRDRQKNVDKIILNMERAAEAGADILLLPECFVTGYSLPVTNEEAIADDDILLRTLRTAAKEFNMGVVATAFTKGEARPQNSAFVIGKSGQILMKYSKVHTCDFSLEACLESGNEFRVCDFDGVKLGVMICYDREYPESARMLMLKGAEIILVPNDCGSMKPRLNALSTRAFENMTGVVMANRNGDNAGNSCAFSPVCWNENGIPIDNEIFLADDVSEGLYFAEFDMDMLRAYRADEMLGNTFRKVQAYGGLLNDEIKEPFIREGQKSDGVVQKNKNNV